MFLYFFLYILYIVFIEGRINNFFSMYGLTYFLYIKTGLEMPKDTE